jgi:2-hydroxychromene-2-carboxylate isomerase
VALAVGDARIGAFTTRIFELQFEQGADIAEPEVIAKALQSMGLEAPAIIAASQTAAVKDALRANTSRAEALGIFGAPTFVARDGELFWGDDRLAQALAWATKPGRSM